MVTKTNMIKYKQYVGSTLLNRKVHFACDCIIGLDVVGTVVNYETIGSEIVYVLDTGDGKLVRVGENTPDLRISVM